MFNSGNICDHPPINDSGRRIGKWPFSFFTFARTELNICRILPVGAKLDSNKRTWPEDSESDHRGEKDNAPEMIRQAGSDAYQM